MEISDRSRSRFYTRRPQILYDRASSFGRLEKIVPAKGAARIFDELGDGAKRDPTLTLKEPGDHRQRVAVLLGPTTPGHAEGRDMSV